MNDSTFNSQFYDFDDFDEPTTSAQVTINSDKSVEQSDNNIITSDSSSKSDEETTPDADEPLWSIDDDTLFYGLGLINHSTGNDKSVFVTWNENYLQNFIFKKSSKTKKINMTKVRLTLPPEEEIKEILIIEYNTLLLMHSGNVYYLSSIKSMHAISWLNGVRCISKTTEGFSVIRLLEDNTLSLEVYSDIVHIGISESTLVCSYDITFDPVNLFNCQWTDEQFTLWTQTVNKENINFMQHLIHKACVLDEHQVVHIFTVSGNVFALVPGDTTDSSTDYHIELLNTYAAPVAFIKIDCMRELCLIFFECGTIDMWFMTKLVQTSLQRLSHHTGSHFVHYDYNATDAVFYFTDSEKVGQIQFKYDAYNGIYLAEEYYKPIADIAVCTWVANIQQLICLSSNNIFYQLNFETTNELPTIEPTPEFEYLTELYELTPGRMRKLLTKAKCMDQIAKMPSLIHEAIETEFIKQQVLAVGKKQKLYEKLLIGSIEFSRELPKFLDKQTILLFTHASYLMQHNSLFALVFLQLKRNDIFQASLWHLHIDYAHTTYSFHIPNKLIYKNFCIVVPLVYNSLAIMPVFQLKMLTFVTNDHSDCLAITLPVQLKINHRTFAQLFALKRYAISLHNDYSIAQLIAAFQQQSTSTRTSTPLIFTLSLPKSCKYNRILNAFKYQTNVIDELDCLTIYFMSTEMKIIYIEQSNSIRLECLCPIALYYTKLYLFYYIKENCQNDQNNIEEPPTSSKMSQLFMQYQCDIERCYGSLVTMDNEVITGTSTELQLERLKSIYQKMRTLPINIFS